MPITAWIKRASGVGVTAFLALAACNDTQLATAPVSADPPVAEINSATSNYGPLDTAHFDGTLSHASTGHTLTAFAWSITNRPAGSNAMPQSTSGNDDQVDFFVDLAGDYTIKLTVSQDDGQTASKTYDFSAVPSQDLHIQLTWNTYTQVDMDLHMIETSAGGTLWDPMLDCHYSNCKPEYGGYLDWGASGQTSDNPRLDIDNITESVPENINIDVPSNGTYEIDVHYYASHAGTDLPTTCNVKIYLNGQVEYEQTAVITNSPNNLWRVAKIDWAGGQGTVTEINTQSVTTGS
jgi:uncharacterized protein YfaP (DUF2135 family)